MARLVDPRDEAPIDPTPVRAGDAIDGGVLGVLMLLTHDRDVVVVGGGR